MVAASEFALIDVLTQIAVDVGSRQVFGLGHSFHHFGQDRLEQIVDHACFIVCRVSNCIRVEVAIEDLVGVACSSAEVEHRDPPSEHIRPARDQAVRPDRRS